MALSAQYDRQKQETANRFCEMDAVDEVLADIKGLSGSSIDEETLEVLTEEVEEYVHYEESLEYILSQIPDKVKKLLV